MLAVRDLKKAFVGGSGTVLAVDGVSFEIRPGEFYTLLGPSGCGKTTTLQCVAGLEMPDEGEIVMADEVVYSATRRIQVPGHRRDIGMVFQSYAIWPHMTVFDNVAFPLVHGRRRPPREQVRERVMSALALVQLDGLADRPAPFLSGGQQQRVALARAIVHAPKLLLLDEPLSNLDAKLREEMRVELRRLVHQLGMTTLYVTHDQVEALTMSDRVAVMHGGRIVQEGTPRELYLTPRSELVADFLGRSNFLRGRVVEPAAGDGLGVVETGVGPLRCSIGAEPRLGDAVVLALRPEGIEVQRDGADGNGNTFAGRVESVLFAGDFLECQVRVATEQLRVKLDPFQELKSQEPIYLHIPPRRCTVVARLEDW